MMIICAKLFSNPTIQDEVMSGHNSGAHKHTWIGKTLYALPPFYGGGIKTEDSDQPFYHSRLPELCMDE